MQAIHMTAPGPADEVLQLVDIPAPEITRPTQIRVQPRAAGVNPVDTKLRSRGVFYPDALPAILGCDGAGIVTDTGTDVKRFRPGDAVWFCHGGLGGAPGNYAEATVLEETGVEAMPASLDYAAAAALPLVSITAWEALFDRAGLGEGQTALIHAGAGGPPPPGRDPPMLRTADRERGTCTPDRGHPAACGGGQGAPAD